MRTFWKLATVSAAFFAMIAGSLGAPESVEAACYTLSNGVRYCPPAGGGAAGLINGNDWDLRFSFVGSSLEAVVAYIGSPTIDPTTGATSYVAAEGLTIGDQIAFSTNAFNQSQYDALMTQLSDAATAPQVLTLFSLSGPTTLTSDNLGTTVFSIASSTISEANLGNANLYNFSLGNTATESLQVLRVFHPTSVAPVPEPSTILLLGGGLAGLAVAGIRRRRQAKQG